MHSAQSRTRTFFSNNTWTLCGIFLLITISLLAPFLFGTPDRPANSANFNTFKTYGIATALLSCMLLFSQRFALGWVSFVSILATFWIYGVRHGFLILFFSILWTAFLLFISSTVFRLIAFMVLLITGGFFFFTTAGMIEPDLLWVHSHWLRLFTLTMDFQSEQNIEKNSNQKSFMESICFLLAPPFLASPAGMQFINFDYFKSTFSLSINEKASRSGCFYLLWGVFCVLSYDWLRFHVPFLAFSIKNPPLVQGIGLLQITAIGWSVFFLKLLLTCGSTALVAGAWRLLGCEMRYDMNMPILSTSFLDYWHRFANYGRDFYLKYVFYPISFYLSAKTSWRVSVAIGAICVFIAIAFVNWTSMHVVYGFPAPQNKHFSAHLIKSLFSLCFLLLSFSVNWTVERLFTFAKLERLSIFVKILLTQIFIAWLFYSIAIYLCGGDFLDSPFF